ncbi:hypothetical protein [Methylocaldum sp.]|uniref:hypothetical protein n=1 Tax=Methylocaldum sp. TaxID=1969727 RepID=UPI002D68AA39|nr:hypothetical protein [Methylocaldum sp.]HYE36166.1 hypothetical protein [Methylocaldum sp.]
MRTQQQITIGRGRIPVGVMAVIVVDGRLMFGGWLPIFMGVGLILFLRRKFCGDGREVRKIGNGLKAGN